MERLKHTSSEMSAMSIRISCSVLTFHAGRRMESELTSQVKEPLTALNTPICARKGMAMFTLKT